MAYDNDHAALMRRELDAHAPREQRMFGALCFMVRGNMVCGVRASGAMFRVGKAAMGAALDLDGVGHIIMGARSMSGYVGADIDAFEDDTTRATLLQLALDFNATLPAK
ncbi:TfoX/Sxy family protein [Rhodobacteraceae bacterium D3-12]|nr:TfoX/Sxy family protein [Rhodobacteraceae bacterium D3-12]